jgi:hypothetical protein
MQLKRVELYHAPYTLSYLSAWTQEQFSVKIHQISDETVHRTFDLFRLFESDFYLP